MEGPIGDWSLASQAHEIEVGYLGNRRGFADPAPEPQLASAGKAVPAFPEGESDTR